MVKFPKHKSQSALIRSCSPRSGCNRPQLGSSALSLLTRPRVPGSLPHHVTSPSRPGPTMSHYSQCWSAINNDFILCTLIGNRVYKSNWPVKPKSLRDVSRFPGSPISCSPLSSEVSAPLPWPVLRPAGLRCPGCSILRTKTQSIAKLPVISTSVSTLQGRYQQHNNNNTHSQATRFRGKTSGKKWPQIFTKTEKTDTKKRMRRE